MSILLKLISVLLLPLILLAVTLLALGSSSKTERLEEEPAWRRS